jgi:hypothetical protein
MTIRLTILLLLTAFAAGAQNYYVNPNSGNTPGDGSNWTNARTNLPSSLTRGTTYWVAAGDYGNNNVVLNTANDGTTRITIKFPTTANHGTDTGWNNSLTNGQARWGGTFDFRTDYWTIDGSVRDETTWTNHHGIRIAQVDTFTDDRPAGDHLQWLYLDLGADLDEGIENWNTNRVKTPVYIRGSTFKTNILVYGCFIHLDSFAQNAGVTNITYASNVFYVGYAKEAIRGQYGSMGGQILYNRFYQSSQPDDYDGTATSSTAVIGIWDESVPGSFDNWTVIGNNIWFSTPVNTSDGAISIGGNNGYSGGVVGLAGVYANNVVIRSNTIVGYQDGKARVMINGGADTPATGNVIRDNRFYSAPNWSVSTTGVDEGNNAALGAAPWTTWNEFIAYGLPEGGGGEPEPEPPSGNRITVGTLIITGP